MMTDIVQQRCGRNGCIAWRLSRPGSSGQEWRPCWRCQAVESPIGPRFGERTTREVGRDG